jgi:hypothetical protein
VSSDGGVDSVSGGNVAPAISHIPDDRDRMVEGGGVSTHVGPTRRSARLANRGGNPSGNESANGSQLNQNTQASRRGRRGANPSATLPAVGTPPEGANLAPQNPSQGSPLRGQVHTGQSARRRARGAGIPQNEEHAPAFFQRKRAHQHLNNPAISRKTAAWLNLSAININGRKKKSI